MEKVGNLKKKKRTEKLCIHTPAEGILTLWETIAAEISYKNALERETNRKGDRNKKSQLTD